MNRGGKRIGAGRPTKAAMAQKAEFSRDAATRFRERAAKDFDRIYNALSDLAFGVYIEEVDDTKVRVYRRPPDRGALQTMIDHLKGKPATQNVTQPDTVFHFHAAHVPRPGKATTGESRPDDDDTDGDDNASHDDPNLPGL